MYVIYLSFREFQLADTKGQLILKLLFCVFKFFQKTNKNKSTWGIIVVKLNFFVRFLEELRIIKSPFEINWPFNKLTPFHEFPVWSSAYEIWLSQASGNAAKGQVIMKLTDL